MESTKKSQNELLISVIIITFKRIKNVVDILNDLKSQSFREFEVIVVSDGCKTAFEKRIKCYSELFPIQCFDTGLISKYGLATARNMGLKNAKSDYCILIDDDCRISKYFIESHYFNREKLTIVGGQRKGLGNEEKILSQKMKALKKLPYQKAIEIKKINQDFPKISLIENNISFYKNEVLEVGSFFDFICFYGIIGQEFFYRCKNYKFKYKYIHNAKIIHLKNIKDVITNKKKNKVIKSIISNIFILPILKNRIFTRIFKNFLSKIDHTSILHLFIEIILWIFVLLFSPFLFLKKLIKKILRMKLNHYWI